MRGENQSTRGKISQRRVEDQRTQSMYMTLSAEIEPGPHWWKASAFTTTPTLLPLLKLLKRYGYHQRENTVSRLFTEIKPCSWTGLISGCVTIEIKYPVLYSWGSQAGAVDISYAFHLYYVQCCTVCGLISSRSQPDLEGFL